MELLTERQIIGTFFKRLAMDTGAGWINLISNLFQSDQASEQYAWLGMSPVMREWIGGRNAKGLSESNMTITNKHFEATLDVLVRDLRRDKSSQTLIRIADLARRSNSHWASLLSTLIINGESTDCYDGQYFFDTDHSEGDSGTQSNDIEADISEYPAATTGTITAPSVEEALWSIIAGINTIVGFKDDQGEPMNEDASKFLVMCPLTLATSMRQAVAAPFQSGPSQISKEAQGAISPEVEIKVVPNVRLSSWTDQFVVFRTDSMAKGLIRQEETKIQMKAKGAGSEYEFDNDAWQFGIDAWRNVGYGFWQDCCLVTMI